MRGVSHGMMVPDCSVRAQAELECGVGFPTRLQVSVGAQASLGKKLKEIISQISATIFHNFCYLSLVGSCSLSKTYF